MSIADTGVTAAVANELDRLLTKQVSQTMPILPNSAPICHRLIYSGTSG